MKTKLVKVFVNGESLSGRLVGVFQKAYPHTPLLRDEIGGQVSYPVAVIETKERLLEVPASSVKFIPDSDNEETYE